MAGSKIRRLHVTFGYSAAGSLETALARAHRSDEVAPLPDDYNMGPIDPGDPDQRGSWEHEHLGEEEPIATSTAVTRFWNRVSNWPDVLIVWMSSSSGVELCGLHALVWRLPEANIHIVDVADQAFAMVGDDRIVERGLLDRATPLGDIARASLRSCWQQLRVENARLRVLTDDGLTSAPIDYFDERIRALITDEWQSCGRVVGHVLDSMSNGRLREFHSDPFIFMRLLHLIDADNDIEGRNEGGPDALWSMRTSWARRRPRG